MVIFLRLCQDYGKKVNESDFIRIEKICRDKNLVISTDNFMKKLLFLNLESINLFQDKFIV